MAPMEDVEDAWADLEEVLGLVGIVPVTYMNSIAGIKALCGRNNGIVCTSSNAKAALEWAFEQGECMLFLPDQHLGRNTPEQLRRAKMVLWQGHCSVHTRFTTSQINAARALHPDINIIAHPECPMETVQAADMVGSTEFIREKVNSAPPGSKWGIGTEVSLANRLAINNPDKTVFCLDSVACPCSTMYRVHPAYVLWMLDGLLEGKVNNEITVPDDIKRDSKTALDRMPSFR